MAGGWSLLKKEIGNEISSFPPIVRVFCNYLRTKKDWPKFTRRSHGPNENVNLHWKYRSQIFPLYHSASLEIAVYFGR